MHNSTSQLEKLGVKLNNIGENSIQVGKTFMPLTASVVATGVVAVKTGIDFETAFAGVSKSSIAILDDMGLTEVRLSNTVLSLANANDLMTNAVNLANNAWQENIALSLE